MLSSFETNPIRKEKKKDDKACHHLLLQTCKKKKACVTVYEKKKTCCSKLTSTTFFSKHCFCYNFTLLLLQCRSSHNLPLLTVTFMNVTMFSHSSTIISSNAPSSTMLPTSLTPLTHSLILQDLFHLKALPHNNQNNRRFVRIMTMAYGGFGV